MAIEPSLSYAPTYPAWHDFPLVDTVPTAATYGNYDSILAKIAKRLNALTGQQMVFLDQYPGSDDDAKLLAMYNDANAQTRFPYMVLGRPCSFADNIVMASAARLYGHATDTLGIVNSELNGGKYNPVKITVNTGGGPWISAPAGNSYDRLFKNLYIESTDGVTQIFQSIAGNDYQSRFIDIGTNGAASIWGTTTEKYVNTGVNVVGAQTHINCKKIIAYIGGSDGLWFRDEGNIGMNGVGSGGGNDPMVRVNAQGKTNFGQAFWNVIHGWRAMLIDGSDSLNSVSIFGARIEGTNHDTLAANNELIQLAVGSLAMYGCRLAQCLYATPNTTTNGYIKQTGGRLYIAGAHVEKADGVSDDAAIVYSTAGVAHVEGLLGCGSSNPWGAQPGTRAAGGSIYTAGPFSRAL